MSSIAFAEYLESVSQGSAYPAVSIAAMGRYLVELPPQSQALKLEERAMPLRRRAAQAEVESRRLAELRDALLPELLSGRIRVPEAREATQSVT